MNPADHHVALLLKAGQFAARVHSRHRREGPDASPYINHPIDVAATLCHVGRIYDAATLTAALLHDTLEDSETTPEELEEAFGRNVRRIVEEVTDDRRLPRAVRERMQVEETPGKSLQARLIKLADKICNVSDSLEAPPPDWSAEKQRHYLIHAGQVVRAVRGTNAALEDRFEQLYRQARRRLGLRRAPGGPAPLPEESLPEVRQRLLDYFERIEGSDVRHVRPHGRLLHQFRTYAGRHRRVFLELMDGIPSHRHTLRAGIYEALADDADDWEDFFLQQLDVLFTAADRALYPWPIFRSVKTFKLLWRVTEGPLQTRLRRFLLLQTRSPYARVRRVATELVGYFIYPDNAEDLRHLEALMRDDDRTVRMQAHAILAELGLAPSLWDMPLLDLLKARLIRWFDEL